METIIVLGVTAVVFVAALILSYLFAYPKGRTYEEVIEEQRRRNEEEREKARQDKRIEKENKKKFKKKDKAGKEKAPQTPEPEMKEPKMVNLEIDPEIIEPTQDVGATAKAKPSKGSKKQKPILTNKNEKPLVAETKEAKEMPHKPIVPKDEVELKHVHEQMTSKVQPPVEQAVKGGKKQGEAKQTKAKEPVVEEKMIKPEKVTAEYAALQTQPAKSSKSSTENSWDGSSLVSAVKSASLSDSEVQSLVDFLLAKQGSSGVEWNKKSQKGDPVALLKKQLEEKERAFQEQQELAMTAGSKVKELKAELATQRSRQQELEKHYKEKLAQQTKELEALQARMQQSHDQHLHELKAAQSHIQQLEQSTDRNLVQKLTEEKKILQDSFAKLSAEKAASPELSSLRQKVGILEKELSSNAVKFNASENSRKSLEQQVAKYEEHIKKLESQEKESGSLMTKRVEEVSQELRKMETKNKSLSQELQKTCGDLDKANEALHVAQSECTNLKTKLQELEAHLSSSDNTKELEAKLQAAEQKRSELEGNVKNLEKQLADSGNRSQELQKELEVVQQENHALREQMRTTQERQQGEGQEARTEPNGDIHKESSPSAEEVAAIQKGLQLKEEEVKQLSVELTSTQTEVATLKEELETQRKKNNDLREKNWKVMEALQKAEKSATDRVDGALKSAREDTQAAQTAAENKQKELLQRLFPEVTVTSAKTHGDWVSSFEKDASVYLQKMSSSASSGSDLQSRVQDLESEKSSLLGKVDEYKSVLDSTEKKLHQLESSVEAEEKKWRSKVQELETALRKSAESGDTLRELEESNAEFQAQVKEYRSVLATTEERLQQLETSVAEEEKKWQEKLKQKDAEVIRLKEELGKVKGSQEDLTDIGFAYQCVEKSLPNIVGEMEKKVISLESDLGASEQRCSDLEAELKEAKSRIVVLESQSQTTTTITTVTTEDNSQDLEELRRQLEAEKKRTKELSSNVVKLNGIIKTGQDALKQEQDLVKKLQDQLETKDGASGSTKGSEVDELRAKLAEKEKQLERELTANKQLSQRLASAAPNDSGTSV